MNDQKISLSPLIAALLSLNEAIENDPNNALENARLVSAEANIPVGWIARVELGFEVMGQDGQITTEEAMAVIDTASKLTFIDQDKFDPFFMDHTPFLKLMETDAALIANDAILVENERILAANQAILDSGRLDVALLDLKGLQPVPHLSG